MQQTDRLTESSQADLAEPGRKPISRLVRRSSFWIILAMLVGLAVLHYAPVRMQIIPAGWLPSGGHGAERILFILPVASAAFAFGYAGGIVALALALAAMLPRVAFMSAHPLDDGLEVAAVALAGMLVVWMIQVQEREKRLRQEAVLRLRTLHDVTGTVSASLEVDQILAGTLERVLALTQATIACIYTLDAAGQELELSVCRCRGQQAGQAQNSGDDGPLELGKRMGEAAWRTGEPLFAEDLEPAGAWSAMAVPLKARNRRLGSVFLADKGLHRFKPQDLKLLNAVGNQVGVALENARLHQDVERQLHVEQYLNSVSEEITSELELDKILPTVLKIAKQLVGADGGAIALLDRDINGITFMYLDGLPAELQGGTVPMRMGLAGEVVALQRPVVVENYQLYPRALPHFVEAGMVSVVGVPLLRGEQSYGTLLLASLHHPQDFAARDVELLVGIGRQAAIAIENAKLYANMRFYVQQITRAQEDERKRIARDLHDDTIQNLIVLSRRMGDLGSQAGLAPLVLERVQAVQDALDQMIVNCRQFSQDLRPSILDDLGLVPALRGLVGRISRPDQLQAELLVEGDPRRLLPEHELTLYRITQEALSNAKRHAEATQVEISVRFGPSDVQLVIRDNGKGFEVPSLTSNLATAGKLGLIGMVERARLLGGRLLVDSDPGSGTIITVSAPV